MRVPCLWLSMSLDVIYTRLKVISRSLYLPLTTTTTHLQLILTFDRTLLTIVASPTLTFELNAAEDTIARLSLSVKKSKSQKIKKSRSQKVKKSNWKTATRSLESAKAFDSDNSLHTALSLEREECETRRSEYVIQYTKQTISFLCLILIPYRMVVRPSEWKRSVPICTRNPRHHVIESLEPTVQLPSRLVQSRRAAMQGTKSAHANFGPLFRLPAKFVRNTFHFTAPYLISPLISPISLRKA